MKDIVAKFYDKIWNQYDKSWIPKILHDDFSFRGSLGQEKEGHAGFAAYVDFIHTALGNYRCDIEDIVAEDNKTFAKMRFSGVHQGELFGYLPTGKPVQWAGAALFTFSGDKVLSLWVLGDVHGLLQQLEVNKDPER